MNPTHLREPRTLARAPSWSAVAHVARHGARRCSHRSQAGSARHFVACSEHATVPFPSFVGFFFASVVVPFPCLHLFCFRLLLSLSSSPILSLPLPLYFSPSSLPAFPPSPSSCWEALDDMEGASQASELLGRGPGPRGAKRSPYGSLRPPGRPLAHPPSSLPVSRRGALGSGGSRPPTSPVLGGSELPPRSKGPPRAAVHFSTPLDRPTGISSYRRNYRKK